MIHNIVEQGSSVKLLIICQFNSGKHAKQFNNNNNLSHFLLKPLRQCQIERSLFTPFDTVTRSYQDKT